MTGTPLDLTPFGPLLSAVGVLYWVLALGVAGLALWLPRTWLAKVLASALVLVAFTYPVLRSEREQKAQRDASVARLDESMALFNERCKSAGEKIVRTVQGVDGVVWMKWREAYSNADNFADQFKLNDPYGRDCGLEDCIAPLLRVTVGAALNPEEAKRHTPGYAFVETIDPGDGQRYRYVAHIEQGWGQDAIDRHRRERGGEPPPYSYQFKLHRAPIERFSARYGITWEDLSTRGDREHWIAGGALKVLDLQTNEVIGERVGYMIDRGQGSQGGFRSPWLFAKETACPEFPQVGPSDPRRVRSLHETRDFALRLVSLKTRD